MSKQIKVIEKATRKSYTVDPPDKNGIVTVDLQRGKSRAMKRDEYIIPRGDLSAHRDNGNAPRAVRSVFDGWDFLLRDGEILDVVSLSYGPGGFLETIVVKVGAENIAFTGGFLDIFTPVTEEGGEEKTWSVSSDQIETNLPPHSEHYHSGDIDVIKFAEANFSKEEVRGFFRISALKYIARAGKKEDPIADLEKAEFYNNKLREMDWE